MQQRTVAAALNMPVYVENRLLRFDDQALQRLESVLFDPLVNQSVELPQVGFLDPDPRGGQAAALYFCFASPIPSYAICCAFILHL